MKEGLLARPIQARWILVGAVVLAVGTLVVLGSRLRVTYQTALTGCAYDAGTGGGLGLLRWSERLQIPLQLLEVPVWEAPGNLKQPSGNCIVTMGDGPWSPIETDQEAGRGQVVRDWLARGNTLVVVTSAPQEIPAWLRHDVLPVNIAEIRPGSRAHGEETVEARPETSEAMLADGQKLHIEADGPRATIPPAASTQKSPGLDTRPWQVAGDSGGGVLFRIPVDKGAVYLLLDAFAWSNAGLDQGDNAQILADILHREVREGVVALDEYRHGHGRAESFFAYFLNLPGSSSFLGLVGVWGLLYFYGRNVRLRPAQEFREIERRTVRESIDAVAQMYERARAAPLVIEAVARRLQHLGRWNSATSAHVQELLRHAEEMAAAPQRPARPAAAMHLVNELLHVRKELYGSRKLS